MKKTIVLLCVMFIAVSVAACSNNERLDDMTSSSIQYTQTEQTDVSDISYSDNAGSASFSETVTPNDTTTEQESQSDAISNTSVPNTTSETYSKSETSSVPEENVANHSSASQSSYLQPTSSQTQTETPTEIPSVPSTSETPKASHDLVIEANGKRFSATLYENETVNAFRQLLPLTLNMSELNGNEKYYYLNSTLPTDSSCPEEIHSGDLMLYGDSCLVLFYKNFSTSYSYTSLGKIDDPSGLADAVGSGDVQITFEIQ